MWSLLVVVTIGVVGVWVMVFRQAQVTFSSSPKTTDSDKSVAESYLPSSEVEYHPSASVFVPILMYHYVRSGVDPSDGLGISLSVSPEKLRSQLSTLKTAGYKTISLTDFADQKYQPKSLVITFDDGYEDQYTEAFAILKELGMTATFFIVHDFVGRDGYMTDSQIAKLKLAGMEIGGHSTSHKNLSTMEYEKEVKDISTSLVGYDDVFCYPSGKYSPVTLDIVSGLNLKAAVTTIYGIATERSKIYELPRIRMVERIDILKRIKEETAIAKKELSPSQRSKD